MSVSTTTKKPLSYAGTGRPSKLTPELQAKVCEYIAAGNYLVTACQAAGINTHTFTDWIAKGERELEENTPGEFSAFLLAAKEAEAQSEVNLVAAVQKHNERNVIAPLAMLDRRFRERWGREPAQHNGGNTYNINIEKAIIDAAGKFDAIMQQRAERAVAPLAIPQDTTGGAVVSVTPGEGEDNANSTD